MSHALQGLISSLLPPGCVVSVTKATVTPDAVRLHLTTTALTAYRPCCALPSSAVHGRYQRQLTDLPWGARTLHIQLTVRKFACRQPSCGRRIFTERLPELAAPSARKTTPLIAVLRPSAWRLAGSLAWGNGVTEGQLHRLKLLKRQD